MLQDRRQHHHRLSLAAAKGQLGCPDAVIRGAGQHCIDRVMPVLHLLQAHVEARFAVEPAFNGGVVAGELELVLPVQLQRNRLQRAAIGQRGQGCTG